MSTPPNSRVALRIRSGFTTDEDELVDMGFQSNSEAENEYRIDLSNKAHFLRDSNLLTEQDQLNKRKQKKKLASGNRPIFTDDFKDNRDNSVLKIDKLVDDEHHEINFTDLYTFDYHSSFTSVLENAENRHKMDPFLNINYDQQQILLQKVIQEEQKVKQKPQNPSPASRFAALPSDTRVVMRRMFNNNFIIKLEKTLVQYLNQENSEDVLCILFDGSLSRLIAHGVAQYYMIPSTSVNYNNRRVTVFEKKANIPLPTQNLSQYLDHTGNYHSSYTSDDESFGSTEKEFEILQVVRKDLPVLDFSVQKAPSQPIAAPHNRKKKPNTRR